jgi:hypothetical protein
MSALQHDVRPAVAPLPAPPAPRRPKASKAGYAWAAVILVAGLVAGTTVGVATYLEMRDRIDRFARTSIPGSVAVNIGEPGGRVIYYEGAGEMPLVALGVRVTGPDGSSVRVSTYGADLRYDAPGSQMGHAVGTFDASTVGRYEVSSDATAPPGAALAIGRNIPASSVVAIVVSVLLIVVGLGGGVVLTIITAIRRH